MRVQSDPVLSAPQRRVYTALVSVWIAANALFWFWWLRPEHIEIAWFYLLFSLCFGYIVSFLPTMYFFFVGWMRTPRPLPAPAGRRVALVSLCVPSDEALPVITRQLEALQRVTYPHDSWILDEGNDPAVRAAADQAGIRYFSRSGIEKYNQAGPPFQAKTKAGNINAWLDAHGRDYDIFVQFDIDHRPQPDYLDFVLGYFADPEVAWVQAPSIYGNFDTWISRGAAEQELILQGPLQRGFYGLSETPFIIGSHTTYRTSAVLEMGGFQPTRAEDHLDTMVLSSHGYRGVFVPEILAIGRGPDTFETYLRQQFAWASSLIMVLFRFAPRLLPRCRRLPALQFLFAESWYPLWSGSLAFLFAMPMLTLLTGARPSSVGLLPFLIAWTPLNLTSAAVWWWTRRWHQPSGLHLSWRGVVLDIARWPIVLWALINVILGIKHPYMITRKESGSSVDISPFPLRVQAIYLVLVWLTISVTWWYLANDPHDPSQAHVADLSFHQLQGYILLALWGSAFVFLVVITNLLTDIADLARRGLNLLHVFRIRLVPIGLLVLTTTSFLLTIRVSSGRLYESSFWPEIAVPSTTGADRAREILESVRAAPAATPADLPGELTQKTPSTATTPLPESTVLPLDLVADRRAIGAYDPWQLLGGVPLDIEHWYVRQDEPNLLAGALERAQNRRTVLVTIEPYLSPEQTLSPLEAVVQGRGDEQLRALAREIRVRQPQVVLLRWGHEMEMPGLYPWSGQDPELYRRAYRHVVSIFRGEGAQNARWVWSPAGNHEAAAYYPGDDVVDFVGMTILGDGTWDELFGYAPRSFAELAEPKYQLLSQYSKPLMISELGVSGGPERQVSWLSDAARALDHFPLFRAVVYFNDVNAPNNHMLDQPDWRVDTMSFEALFPAAQ